MRWLEKNYGPSVYSQFIIGIEEKYDYYLVGVVSHRYLKIGEATRFHIQGRAKGLHKLLEQYYNSRLFDHNFIF